MAVDYLNMVRAWERWLDNPDNQTLANIKYPELWAFNCKKGYCGPGWRPSAPWTIGKLWLWLHVSFLAWIVPDKPFGIPVNYAGFWHDRLYLMGGTRKDRRKADSVFLEIIWQKVRAAHVKRWRKYCAYAASIPYFIAVRLLGWTCFRYTRKGGPK